MTTFISSKSAKFAAGLVGVLAGVAMIATSVSAATFSTNLKQGSKGADVKNLQVLLNSDPATQVATTGAGSPGNETTTFGPATKAAVIKFQNKYASEVLTPAGLTAGTGFVGALTRSKLNTMGSTTSTTPSTSTTPTTPVTTGPVSVSLASDNPAAAAVVAGQATADLAHFAFSGSGKITNVKLMRTGISSNSTLSNVYLYNGNVRVADGASVNNTDSTITFNNLNITAPVTLSVKADIAASTAGQIVGVQLISYTVSGSSAATVSISGNYMNVASATLAGVTASSTSVTTASINAGTMGHTFWTGAVNVSTRSVSLKGASFKFIGSAPTDAVQNLKLYVNGLAVGSSATINSDSRLSFDFGTSPVVLNTGSQTVEVRGDIMKGSNRTAQFNLENAGDLMVMDSQLGVNVAVTAPTTSTFAAQNGTTVTINTGSITTTIDPTFSNLSNVTGGATGATIGKFKLQAYGEDVKVSSLAVTPTITGSTPVPNGLNNVSLFYNGSQVGSSQNMAGTSTALTFQLGSALIVSAGTTGVLEVRADLQSAANVNYTAGTASVVLVAGSSNGQGQNSSATLNVPTANVGTTGLTVAAGALSIAQAAGYAAAQTVNPNTANVKLGSFVLQNTSTTEGVRISNLAVGLTATTTNLSNLRTTETSGSGAIGIAPQATNNFSVNFTLAPGQTKTIDIMGDFGAATSGVVITTLLPTAIGASSNVTVTPGSATTGQTLTIQTGSLAVPTLNPAPGSLSAQLIVGGSSPALSQYNFVATNGTATITELKFTVGGTATAPITQVSVGGQTAPVVSGVAYLTGLNISVPQGASGANVTATHTFAPVGINGVTSATTATSSITYMKYTIGGTTTSTSTINVPSNTMTVVGTKPTLSITDSTETLLNGLVKVADITVTADAAGDLKLGKLPLSVTSTGVATATTSTDNIVVKDTAGNTITTTNATFAVTAGGTGTANICFDTATAACASGNTAASAYLIPAGTSKTFRIYVTAATVSGAVNTTSFSTKLGAAANGTWYDIAGNNTTAISFSNVYNYPTDTSVITN